MNLKQCIFLIHSFLISGILVAQDYLISFEGSGAASSVVSVKVENITQGTHITISGGDLLHLKAVILSDEQQFKRLTQKIIFSPNPMTDYTQMRFITWEAGYIEIAMFDLSGNKLMSLDSFLWKGLHTYRIYGIKKGFYIIKVKCGISSYSSKLICSGSMNNNAKIVYENSISLPEKQIYTEVVMKYNTGDRLRFTGISGLCTTIINDIPDKSKTVKFIFANCTDADGNNYPVIQIGNQLWMAENLKTTSYRDNTPIPNVTDGLEWAGLTTPAYCWYSNNIRNKDVYGALYNWYVVKIGKLCPEGWHVPTDDEWHEMVLYLDPDAVPDVEESKIAGGKLKEEGTVHWSVPNTGATDEYGFTALPGGVRRYDGVFSGPTGNGNWRTSSEYDDTQVWYRYIFYYSAAIYRKPTNMQAGYSVRCVLD